ncbi:MAG TPA: Rnase Y domain-containing protein, partial [Candidatus Paceibacterota bacterium]|nr:Rnase Y domain-containing protein [Candidatus Paceibacterota bacterium]
MSWLLNILGHAAPVAVGAALCYLLLWWRDRNARKLRALEAEALLSQARNEAEGIVRDARLAANREALQLREQIEQSFAARRAERAELERRLAEREALINSQLERLVEQEKALQTQKDALAAQMEAVRAREQELARQERQHLERLEAIAGLTQAQAREALLRKVEQEALRDANTLTRHILEDARTQAETKARHILSLAIQRYAGEHTFQTTTASITLQGDELKGRIIGREGRNIRAFEAATGVTVLIDDTPGAVLLSGFDPVRREIAREAMMRLIQDGRIHPTRIEEIVAQVTQEMDQTILRLGDEAVRKTGLTPLSADLVKFLGRLHFRHSY